MGALAREGHLARNFRRHVTTIEKAGPQVCWAFIFSDGVRCHATVGVTHPRHYQLL